MPADIPAYDDEEAFKLATMARRLASQSLDPELTNRLLDWAERWEARLAGAAASDPDPDRAGGESTTE